LIVILVKIRKKRKLEGESLIAVTEIAYTFDEVTTGQLCVPYYTYE